MKRDCCELVLVACDACMNDGTMTRAQVFRVRVLRRVSPRRFRRYCEAVVDELYSMAPLATRSDGYAFDPDVFEQLLQILIEYLPQLLEILLPLFQRGDD